MALPKQVQKAIEEVAAVEAQMKAPVEPEVAAAQPENDEQTTEAIAVETQAELPTAEETPPQPTPVERVEDNWEHKYRRLQGKYDAEVPRLHAQVKELAAALEELKAVREAPPAPVTVAEALVTDADVSEYGADLINLQRRVAREELRAEFEALKATNEDLRKQIQQTGSQVGALNFEQRLHRMVPDFPEVNESPAWIAWLDVVDPISRVPRRVIAQEAYRRGDAEAVAHYVSLYRAEHGEAPVKVDRTKEIARQVQPTRTAATTAPSSKQGRIYSSKDVEALFKKVASLSAMQRFDEAKKLEAELDAAFMDGRISA